MKLRKLEYFPDNRGLDHAGEATALDREKRLRATRSLDGARALQEAGGRGLPPTRSATNPKDGPRT